MSLFSGVSKTNVLKMFVRPFPLFLFPATTFAFLAYAVALFLVVSVNLLNSFVLEAPPYNWSIAKDGLINIPYVLWLGDGVSAGANMVIVVSLAMSLVLSPQVGLSTSTAIGGELD